MHLAAGSGVHRDRLLQAADLLPELIEIVVQLLGVVSLLVNLLLEFGDASELLLTALSGGLSVPESLSLQLLCLLIVHAGDAVHKVVRGCRMHGLHCLVGSELSDGYRGRCHEKDTVLVQGEEGRRGVFGEGWRRRKGWGREGGRDR
ncbi:hypothetical protein PENTCL1PPCAC_5415 [Pristionchus entomophagus]|uniref:Uncharacterized protein n=1 Tax=Pristionchus entomophagus TaxID=358040 RepID=A0AAV5SJY7_9BILA|nr:hypothetical protein PENTCL1PPCAC_5415 [Pristionchus entomophagus]